MPRARNGLIGAFVDDGATGKRVIGVAARVQDLHRDEAACGVHRIGDEPVTRHLPRERKLRRLGLEPSGEVGRDASRHHERHAALRARRVERGHALVSVARLLEPGVHGPHQHAIPERDETEVERREEIGVLRHGAL
jgi:hypothetical protein